MTSRILPSFLKRLINGKILVVQKMQGLKGFGFWKKRTPTQIEKLICGRLNERERCVKDTIYIDPSNGRGGGGGKTIPT